jgi:hypothetical protein
VVGRVDQVVGIEVEHLEAAVLLIKAKAGVAELGVVEPFRVEAGVGLQRRVAEARREPQIRHLVEENVARA